MNPTLITFCATFQVAILYVMAGWPAGVAIATGVVAIVAMFAFTRERWDPHLDMILLMAGPGGLGMMSAMLLGPACHVQRTWTAYWVMTGGMFLFSVPLAWLSARCLQQARRDGYGGRALLLDVVGMQAGMTVAYLPVGLLPIADPRGIWLHHAMMLVGMLVGMLLGMAGIRYILRRATKSSGQYIFEPIQVSVRERPTF